MRDMGLNAGNADQFLMAVAHDVVRLAATNEGLGPWLTTHGGNLESVSLGTRKFSHELFGDTEDATLFNAALTIEIDRQRASV